MGLYALVLKWLITLDFCTIRCGLMRNRAILGKYCYTFLAKPSGIYLAASPVAHLFLPPAR